MYAVCILTDTDIYKFCECFGNEIETQTALMLRLTKTVMSQSKYNWITSGREDQHQDSNDIQNKLSPAGIGSKKLSSQVQFTLRLVLLRKVSSEKLSSQIQFCLRLVLLRKTQNPAMFQNQGNWSLIHPFSKLSLQINFEDT